MPKSISKHAHNYILIKGTFQYLNNFIYIPWIFRIPNLIKPKQIVSTFVFILHFSVISPDTFCPMIEFIVFPCTWIGKSKKIVLVTAYWRTEPSGLQNGRSQYNFWVQDSVSYDFFIKVGDGKFRKIVFWFSNIICILLLFCFVSVSAVLHCISHYPALSLLLQINNVNYGSTKSITTLWRDLVGIYWRTQDQSNSNPSCNLQKATHQWMWYEQMDIKAWLFG